MVRLWGGGVYEPDIFYDICDGQFFYPCKHLILTNCAIELGILVWQDFQFACGVYPAHDDFVASVKQEAEDTVLRLRHHPSIALFCGNNEDYQMVLQWGGIFVSAVNLSSCSFRMQMSKLSQHDLSTKMYYQKSSLG